MSTKRLRLIVLAGLAALGAALGVYLSVQQHRAPAPRKHQLSYQQMLRAVRIPNDIGQVLAITGNEPRVLIAQTGNGMAPSTEYVDTIQGVTVKHTAGHLIYLQLGLNVYALTPHGCFQHTTYTMPLTTNFAEMNLPAGVPGMSYTYPSPGVVNWTQTPIAGAPGPAGFVRHGQDIVDPSTHQIRSAVAYLLPHTPAQRTTFSYPSAPERFAAPADICHS